MLRGNQDDEDEDDQRRNPLTRFIKRASPNEVVADFTKAATSLTSLGLKSAGTAGGQGADGGAGADGTE
jgi:hypothetical protein